MRLILVFVVAACCAVPMFSQVDAVGDKLKLADHKVRYLVGDKKKESVITFRLDTASGDLWRFTGTNLVQVPVGGLKDLNKLFHYDTELCNSEELEKLRKLSEKIRIPEVSFSDASLEYIVEHLNKEVARLGYFDKGIVILLNGHPQRPDLEIVHGPSLSITIDAKNVPLSDVIVMLAESSVSRVKVSGNKIILLYSDYKALGDIYRLPYNLSVYGLQTIREYSKDHDGIVNESTLKGYFSSYHNVEWPVGSSIDYRLKENCLTVANTATNMMLMNKAITAMNIPPGRVNRFRFVYMDDIKQGVSNILLLDSDTGVSWQYKVNKAARNGQVQEDEMILLPPVSGKPESK